MVMQKKVLVLIVICWASLAKADMQGIESLVHYADSTVMSNQNYVG